MTSDGWWEVADILRTPGEPEAIDTGLAELARGEDVDGPTALAPYLRSGEGED